MDTSCGECLRRARMTQPRPLTLERIQQLLSPYDPAVSEDLAGKLALYLQLLLRWNERTNLTAIRDPERIMERHFGESLFAARHLPIQTGTLLDVGSGAGFPGFPIALALPSLSVTLAESQGKKAAFLQEATRQLACSAKVWPYRVELMPAERQFDLVTLRAVDDTEAALRVARTRVRPGGWLVHLTSSPKPELGEPIMPKSEHGVIRIEQA